jgi:hypothetical protein
MLWACRAAQLDRRRRAVNRRGEAMSLPVARALTDLEAWLEVDTSELWNDLLDAEEPSRPVSVAAGFQGLSEAELELATAPLDPAGDEEHSLVRLREESSALHDESSALHDESSALHDESSAPASSPFPLLRRLA